MFVLLRPLETLAAIAPLLSTARVAELSELFNGILCGCSGIARVTR